MKKMMILCAAAIVAASTYAAATDMGVLITSSSIEDYAKVENATNGTAAITIVDNNSVSQSVTVYNKATLDTALGGKADKATTLSGYGINDAYISSGTIHLGSESITPLTAESLSLANLTVGSKTYNGSSAVSVYATDIPMSDSDNTTVSAAIGTKANSSSIPTLNIGGSSQMSNANTIELGGYYVADGNDGKPHLWKR